MIRFVAFVLTMFTFAAVVHAVIWGGPMLQYKFWQRSTKSECDAVHLGMTLAELQDRIHSRTWPMEESLSVNQFSFGDWEICQVEIDPRTSNVVRAKMLQAPAEE